MFGLKISEMFEWMVSLCICFSWESQVMAKKEEYYSLTNSGFIGVGGKNNFLIIWLGID